MKTIVKNVLFGREQPRPAMVRGGLLRGMTIEMDSRIDTQQVTGLYEREIMEPVRRLASNASSAVDIGAGDGYYTLYFASRPKIRQVIACEPDVGRVALLKRNLSFNPGCHPEKVSVRPVFVGRRRDGVQDLESLIRDIPEPALLKIDVEGAELEVLESGKDSLERRDVALIVETHSSELERQCIAFLEELGFECGIRKNGWYRKIVPELRPLAHNRWLIAERPTLKPAA